MPKENTISLLSLKEIKNLQNRSKSILYLQYTFYYLRYDCLKYFRLF